jgi:hypothetical protein
LRRIKFVNRIFDKVTRTSLVVVIAATAYFTTNKSEASEGYVPFSGAKTAWHEGFDRYDFLMDDATGAITRWSHLRSKSRISTQTGL